MQFNGKDASITFQIKAVDSIPCDLRGQTVAFDSDGNIISDELKMPWPMPWIKEEIAKRASGAVPMPGEKAFRIYNPEEPDQFVFVEVNKY